VPKGRTAHFLSIGLFGWFSTRPRFRRKAKEKTAGAETAPADALFNHER